MSNLPQNRLVPWLCVALALLTAAVYWPVVGFEFVNYDDPHYIFNNPHVREGISAESLTWAFTASHSSNWHPLTWLSHMLDCELFGLSAGGHHATNLLLHSLNAVLILLLLRALTGAVWRSAFVAALFALHPLHVESVAWVSERKDLLSTFFWALAILAYVRYTKRSGAGNFALVLLLFAAGLMSKPMLVTLPCLLLLLDFWPLRRTPDLLSVGHWTLRLVEGSADSKRSAVPWPRLVAEKIPLFAMSFVSIGITLWAQTASITPSSTLPLPYRVQNAVVSCFRYLAKMIWPSDLAINYPLPASWPFVVVIGAGIVVFGLTAIVIRNLLRRPYLFTGWFWFLGTLVPVIGLVQVGMQSMADRYTYIPLIGLFIIVAWGAHELSARWCLRPLAPALAATLALAACIVVTSAQLPHWRNSIRLFDRALSITPDNFMARYNLAVTYLERGQLDAAREQFERAATIYPTFALVHNHLGQIYSWQNKPDEAIAAYQNALRTDPKLTTAQVGLAAMLTRAGRVEEAAEYWVSLLQLRGEPWAIHDQIGLFLAEEEKFADASKHFSHAITLNPNESAPLCHLALSQERLGNAREAVRHYRMALALNPRTVDALNNLAWLLAAHNDATIRNGPEAVRLAERACELTGYQQPLIVGTLGAAYAEDGRFEAAVATAHKAERLAASIGNEELATRNARLAELYNSRQPYRETATTASSSSRENPSPPEVPPNEYSPD